VGKHFSPPPRQHARTIAGILKLGRIDRHQESCSRAKPIMDLKKFMPASQEEMR